MLSIMSFFALRHDDISVRLSAIKLFEEAHVNLQILEKKDVIKTLMADNSLDIQRATLKYLASVATSSNLSIVEDILEDKNASLHKEAKTIKLLVDLRENINQAIPELLKYQAPIDSRLLKEVINSLPKIDDVHLLNAIQRNNSDIRIIALKELVRRDILTGEKAYEMRNDSSLQVREICYAYLVNKNYPITPSEIRESLECSPTASWLFSDSVDPKAIILTQFRKLSAEELLKKIDWRPNEGPIAYEALVLDHFPRMKNRVREELNNEFSELKQQYLDHNSKLSELALEESKSNNTFTEKYLNIIKEHEKLIESSTSGELGSYISSKYVSSALAGLAVNGDSSDAEISRKYLTSTDTTVWLEAIRILERFGDFSDVASLIEICKNSYGEVKELAARAALKSDSGINGTTISFLLESKDSELVKLAIRSLLISDQQASAISLKLEPILKNEYDGTRILVLAYFVKRFSDEELEQLLDRYMTDSYYYDVVCWIDRIIYAPPLFKQMYRKQLEINVD